MDQQKNNYLIKDWKLPSSIEKNYTSDKNQALNGCSKLNVLIGPNNSGKSLLLRSLFSDEAMEFIPATIEYQNIIDRIQNANMELSEIANKHNIVSLGDIHNFNNCLPTPQYIKESSEWLEEIKKRIIYLRDISAPINFPELSPDIKHTVSAQFQHVTSRLVEYIDEEYLGVKYKFKKIYIPSIRSLRKFGETENPLRECIAKEYFPGGIIPDRNHIGMVQAVGRDAISGMELYSVVRSYLLGSLAQREDVRKFEQFISKYFFNNQPIALIPREDSEVLVIKIGKEKERPIYEIGDGIQQIIILTIPIFLFRYQHLLLFLEEPELHMHPGYQRKLIDVLLHEPTDKSRQTVIATHSNQFLDITLDESSVSIFKLEKKLPDGGDKEKVPTFKIIPSTNKDFQLLKELGIHNSSVMLSNCTIWVEGITDRMYIRHYLKILTEGSSPQYMEDLHYSFVEYGGSCITHWSFLDEEEGIDVERLCGNLFLIADSDKGKEDQHKKLEKALRERYCKLPCREIENLLTPEVIVSIIKDYEKNDVELNKFSQNDYKEESLGKYIDDIVLKDKTKSKRYREKDGEESFAYATQSGTIKDKVNFAEKAINFINTPEDISQETKALVAKLVEFIQKNNP